MIVESCKKMTANDNNRQGNSIQKKIKKQGEHIQNAHPVFQLCEKETKTDNI